MFQPTEKLARKIARLTTALPVATVKQVLDVFIEGMGEAAAFGARTTAMRTTRESSGPLDRGHREMKEAVQEVKAKLPQIRSDGEKEE